MAEDSKVLQVENPNPETVGYQPAVQSANTLFHFEKKSEYLFSIIEKMAIVPRYCVEDIDYLDIGIEEIAYPMLCFCDINLHKIQEHMNFYGQYGIAFSKQWGISRGIQPIQYVNPNSILRHDFTEAFQDKKLFEFLASFCGNDKFAIGAICSAPLFLARAGILKGKQYTGSIYMDFFDLCPFLERGNFVPAPIVISDNIVTAGGSNFNGFAVAMAHLLGLECPDKILSGYMDDWAEEEYEQYLPKEAIEEAKAMFSLA